MQQLIRASETAPDSAAESVLMVGHVPGPDAGVRTVGDELADRLAARGWTVLRTSAQPTPLRRGADMMLTAFSRRAEYAVAQVDVFSGRAFLWAEAVAGTLQRLGKPYVLSLHGGGLPAFAARWPRRVRRLLRAAPAVNTPSGFLRDEMRRYRDDVQLLPNGLARERYTFRLRAAPGPRLVWVRAFHRLYLPAVAPAVLARLAAEFPAVELTMVGPDKGDGALPEVQRTAEAAGVSARLKLPGGVPNSRIPALLDAADIFLNTAGVDNMPVSILEAMASGLCIVSTSVGGIPYLLRDGHDGLLVPPGDADAMARAVRRVLTEPGLAATLSRNARARSEAFGWDSILPRWEALLSTLGAQVRG